MKVYISGKITGDPNAREKFAIAKADLDALGYEALDPMQDEPDGKTWEYYMRRDITKLMTCDAIYMLKDWKQSRGAKVEHTLAVQLHMKVMEE